MTLNPTHKLLFYFQDFLESNKLEFLKDIALEEIRERCRGFIEFEDSKNGIIKYWKTFLKQHSNEEIEGLVTFDFYKEHKIELLSNAKSVIKDIDRLVYSKTEANETYTSSLKNINLELYYLSQKADKLYPSYSELLRALKLIENHLLIKYNIKPFAKKIADEKFSYFGIKEGVKPSLIEKLFWIAEKYQLIDIDVTDKDTFLKVLTANPADPNCVIHFKCFSYLAFIFLDEISPLFGSLNSTHIGDSNRFYTKKLKVLNSVNYDTLQTRANQKSTPKIESLKNEIRAIVKR